MGITGLWPLLEPSCQPITLESLEGKRLAVDVSIWIYQAQLGYSSDAKCPHLQLMINRISKLLFYKIRPVFVFDGPGVPSFKYRVLEERRQRKFADDLTITEDKKRHLERLARGPVRETELESIISGLTKSSKRPAADDELFHIQATSAAEVVTLSDDEDADIIIEKDTRYSFPRSEDVEKLIDTREQIRLSRLNPDAIPSNTEEFCKFQLQRLLHRNELDRRIKELSNKHITSVTGRDVMYCSRDGRRATHLITRETDPDIDIIDPEDDTVDTRTWGDVDLTLDHLSYKQASLPLSLQEDEDVAELNGRMYISKSSMIEDLWKRRIGISNRASSSLHQDRWSSDSGDDDFIDVPDLVDLPSEKNTPIAPQQPSTVDKEWDPQLADDLLSSPQSSQNTVGDSTHGRDSSTYKELQDFLTACGFPWLESPGEAEAQCVELERLGLVQGIVSDDSDVWAFGAENVYRHLFSKTKQVQHYEFKRIAADTGLNQADFISIAIISGGDYSPGVRGVGVVSVIEILAELSNSVAINDENISLFLRRFESWLFREHQFSTDISLLRKIRTVIERQNRVEHIRGIANVEVVKAYLNPNVDSSSEQFRWRSVDIPRISSLVQQYVGWDDEMFKKNCLQPLERWNEFITGQSSYQMHMTSYCHQIPQNMAEQRVKLTKRVLVALEKLQKRRTTVICEPSLICQSSFVDDGSVTVCNEVKKSTAKQLKRKTPITRRPTTQNKKAANAKCKPGTSLNLSESSDEG